MFSVTRIVNEGKPEVVANKATRDEALATAAQLALTAATKMTLARTTPQASHYHKINVFIQHGSSVELICTNATHASHFIRFNAQEVDGRR